MIFHPVLLNNSTNGVNSEGQFYLTVLDEGLEKAFLACKPANLIKSQIKRVENKLEINEKEISINNKKVFIIGAGKATYDMAQAFISLLGSNYIKGIINIPQEAHQELKNLPNTEIIRAGHPIPDIETFIGTQKQIDLLSSLTNEDIVFVLISGGASALFELPDPSISNEDIIETYKQLVVSGLSITDINKIRKFLSSIKGGKLLKKTRAQVYGLLLSDVLGDDLSAIGSGPTVPEPVTSQEIMKILKYNSLTTSLPETVLQFFSLTSNIEFPTSATDKSYFSHGQNFLLGSNKNFLETLDQHLKNQNLLGSICSRIFSGEAKEIGSFLAEYCSFPYTGNPKFLLYGGESVVTIEDLQDEKVSRGGRNQELILSYITKSLQTTPIMNVIILSIGTDGIDGKSINAGAIFCSEYIKNKELKLADLSHHLIHHNSAQSLPLEYYIKTGQTGTNVSDILIILTY